MRVFTQDPSSTLGWVLVGNGIDGESILDSFGYSVSLSRNGEVIAIGTPWNNGDSYDSGHVRVYQTCEQVSTLLVLLLHLLQFLITYPCSTLLFLSVLFNQI